MLLDASVATTAGGDSAPMSTQPWCGWDDGIFIHLVVEKLDTAFKEELTLMSKTKFGEEKKPW